MNYRNIHTNEVISKERLETHLYQLKLVGAFYERSVKAFCKKYGWELID